MKFFAFTFPVSLQSQCQVAGGTSCCLSQITKVSEPLGGILSLLLPCDNAGKHKQ